MTLPLLGDRKLFGLRRRRQKHFDANFADLAVLVKNEERRVSHVLIHPSPARRAAKLRSARLLRCIHLLQRPLVETVQLGPVFARTKKRHVECSSPDDQTALAR